MAKLFIFGIGGTGARVMRSLTMLMASGVKLGVDEVVPILIDPDAGNADLTRTTSLLNDYANIKQCLTQPNENKFFGTGITNVTTNYYMELKDTSSMKFADYIGLKTMDKASRSMTEMLFSGENLDSDMKVGFKGNPNVGSVVLNQLVGTDAFQAFASLFSAGDKIFIINSIFGGTGASGFPLLLKILRGSTPSDYAKASVVASSVIGAVTVLPYFTIKSAEESKSKINSSTFLSKAKSALAYYEENIYDNKQIDQLYFIGDDMMSEPYENNEGGPDQKNNAHLVEMMAATAIVDFSKVDGSVRPARPCSKELGLKVNDNEDPTVITFDNFYDGLRDMLFAPMVEFALMANVFHYHFNDVKSSTQDYNQRGEFNDIFTTAFMKLLENFLENYRAWLAEMEGNKRSLKLFNLDSAADPFMLVKGVAPKKSGWLSKKKYDLLFHQLASATKQLTKVKRDDPNAFMEMYYIALRELVTKKFK